MVWVRYVFDLCSLLIYLDLFEILMKIQSATYNDGAHNEVANIN